MALKNTHKININSITYKSYRISKFI